MNNQEHKTILLVEDDAATSMVETHLLKGFGYDVVAVKSGEEAIQVATCNDKISLVLMDLDLGSGIDGTEAARQIIGKRHLPIVFLTAHAEKEYVERINRIAGYGYVLKSSGNAVLQFSVEMALNLFEAQEALQASEDKFFKVFKTAPYAITITSVEDGRFVDVNDAFISITGFTREEALADSSVGLKLWVDEDDRQRVVSALHAGLAVVGREYLFQTKSGKVITCLFSAQMIKLSHGPCILSSTADITERKLAEEMLKRSRKEFKELFDDAPVGYHEIDVEGRIVRINATELKMLGYSIEEMLGRPVWQLTTDPESSRRAVLAKLSGNLAPSSEPFEREYRRKDGKTILLLIDDKILRSEDGPVVGIRSVLQDITERKQAEAEKAKLEGQLQQSHKMEAVGQLAGGVAHDFNNILQIILGNVELTLSRMEPDNPLRPDLEEVKSAGLRAADLTRQLLGFARKQTIAPRPMDLNATVEGMLKMLRRLIGEDIEVVWTPRAGLWPIRMDPVQIDQILINLCVNARDVIAGVGTVQIATENVRVDELHAARHDGVSLGDYVLLMVSDTGCGMDKEMQAKIFEPFFTTKEAGKGTGLGLATVYGIVQQNQGHIGVYSEPGMGATLHIYLPRHMGKDAAPAAEGPAKPFARGCETLLLVEDDTIILKMSDRMLRKLGYNVLAAGTAEVVLRLAKEHADEIRLLVTDVVMPGMNGGEIARQLKARHPNLKCLFMSGFTADIIARQGILEGSDHFIQKPFSLEALAAKVRDALAP